MASTPVKKPTIGNLTALFYIGLAVLFDAVKILLLLVDAIPLIGAPIGFIGSWIISALEFIFITVGLYLAGAYRGKNSTINGLITMGIAMIDFVPILDDFPFTTGGVIMIILRSRANDKVEELEKAAKNASLAKHQREQEVKGQAARIAVQNANATRVQAMATSIKYARNPSGTVPPPAVPEAANDNELETPASQISRVA